MNGESPLIVRNEGADVFAETASAYPIAGKGLPAAA